jgi:hypothetical protein
VTHEDTEPEVRIPARAAGTFVRLHGLRRPHDDALVLFGVQAEAPGLSADIAVETLNGDGLAEFIQGLHDDFRGWAGERIWKSFRGDLELRAVHDGRLIWLSFTLRFPEPTEADAGICDSTVRVHLTPGQDLTAFSADLSAFLDRSADQ